MMARNGTDIQIAFCGSAGDGTIAVGDILKQSMARAGYRVIAFDQYPAEIRGFGKCIARTRITSSQVYSMKHETDVLVSLDDSHATPHVAEVRQWGAVIYDNAPISRLAEGRHISGHVLPGQIPYGLAVREISERATGANRSRNMVALGYVAGLYGMPREAFHASIREKFRTKAAMVADTNVAAFDAGFEEGETAFRFDDVTLSGPPARKEKNPAVMMTGNAAVVQGCLDAGLDTYFGYPITPATTIMERLARELPARGARMLQTEDEISAVGATIGAGYTGARAATATSGPGLALMAEMIGLGVMAEVPAVIIVSQRGGPSTGMPTKTEQSDLNIAVFGGAGDAQRIVLAPTNVEGCWRCTGRAFEMAERYQTPVIVLLDLYLSNRYETVIFPARRNFPRDQGKSPGKRQKAGAFRRFELTDDGVSPRRLPGDPAGVHTITGLEHNEAGRPDDQMHAAMSEKRHRKLEQALEHPGITIQKRFGDTGKVDVGLLAWGSTFGEALEAMMLAREEGIRCAAMKVVMLSPLPLEPITAFLDDCTEVLVPELNYEGQFANLVSGALGRPLNRLDQVPGTPMRVSDILDRVRALAGKRRRAA
ncbi:MAG: 2-oxoacid:acceptor oxidoreductase subunit alpha [Alphaproteobacteria bacterium]|jgi:2-oxoglutarate ferredoxin oxidoreductase subunit alpha|nr:2-oxoacid:acceptor oxidoreductase subunit alpha [Alphaproteobacteria bacterium]